MTSHRRRAADFHERGGRSYTRRFLLRLRRAVRRHRLPDPLLHRLDFALGLIQLLAGGIDALVVAEGGGGQPVLPLQAALVKLFVGLVSSAIALREVLGRERSSVAPALGPRRVHRMIARSRRAAAESRNRRPPGP